jgi:NADP-dependent 3-hydroxy acid dehydrogenase YdfG
VPIAINQRGGFEMEGSSGKSLSYIVGGSSGMGLATARLLVADGGTVVLVARDQDKLAARKGELEAGGRGKVETIAADFYDAGAVLCQEGARAPCCTRDEGGPFGAVL